MYFYFISEKTEYFGYNKATDRRIEEQVGSSELRCCLNIGIHIILTRMPFLSSQRSPCGQQASQFDWQQDLATIPLQSS
jgi:hypothetical protein